MANHVDRKVSREADYYRADEWDLKVPMRRNFVERFLIAMQRSLKTTMYRLFGHRTTPCREVRDI